MGLVRVVSRRVADGRVTFNQVTLVQQPAPSGVLLVAIDLAAGLYVWLKPHDEVDARAHDQAPGYSRGLPAIDPLNPPAWLGQPVFIPSTDIDAPEWEVFTTAQTMTLNRAVRELFGQ
jgi:hypothetical protein